MSLSPAVAQVGANPQGIFSTPAPQGPQTLCEPQVIGNRRIPKESILARLFSHQGDLYDPAVVERDFNSLWNTGYFENVRIEKVDTPQCVQLVVYVREKPTIREIDYKGLNAVTQSDVQERFKKAKVGLSVESQFDQTRVKRAETVLKDLLAEHGHQFATIRTEVKTIPPASVAHHLQDQGRADGEGGQDRLRRQQQPEQPDAARAMVNLRPIGIPHSIILENLFARTFDASKLDEDTERVRQAYQDRGYFKAQTSEPQTHVRDAGGINPFTLRPSTGKRIDILMPVEEGERYRLGGITFTGNKAVTNTKALRAQFAQKDGEWFNASLFAQGPGAVAQGVWAAGLHQHRGDADAAVRRGQEAGLLEHRHRRGQAVLRVADRVHGQHDDARQGDPARTAAGRGPGVQQPAVGPLDPAAEPAGLLRDAEGGPGHGDAGRMPDDGTVDLLLKLKEKGKNSIGLNGGISGLSGTFIGAELRDQQLPRSGRDAFGVQANIGDLSRNLSFGFNEPYLRNKPISLGVEVFDRRSSTTTRRRLLDRERHEREPVERAAVAADQLQHGDDRIYGVDQRAAEASVCG